MPPDMKTQPGAKNRENMKEQAFNTENGVIR
jgi:hypothetical protein